MTTEATDTFTCRLARHELVDWTDSPAGQYGLACLDCKLFWCINHHSGGWTSRRLDEAYFPRAYRGVPRYRALVGWTGT